MSGTRVLGDITQPNVESRFQNLATPIESKIDVAVHPEGEKLLRGSLFGKTAGGKFRAYFEGKVATGGNFSTAAATFTLEEDPGQDLLKHLRVGDVIESVTGTALGTVATFNPTTGVGTLTGNSANNLTAGNNVRIQPADLSLVDDDGRILKSEVLMGTVDESVAMYTEGFFTAARVLGLTAAAKTALGTTEPTAGEIRLR